MTGDQNHPPRDAERNAEYERRCVETIIDYLKNAPLYLRLGGNIATALKYLQNADFSGMESGNYPIAGENVYAVVKKSWQTKTADECHWEAHKHHLDIHVLFDGTENMAYSNVAELEAAGDYDAAEDIYWLKGPGDLFTAKPGMFVLFFPEDAHMPDLAANSPEIVNKVVIKVKV
jgi:YhcH/YjgK/YiaL family protein